MVHDFINTLEIEFLRFADASTAQWQKNYMKNKFEFYGIRAPKLKEIEKPFLQKDFLPPKTDIENLAKSLWNKPQREYQYFGIHLLYKYRKQIEFDDIKLFEHLIVNKSWWDSVDGIGPKLVGDYFLKFPEQRDVYTEKWLNSDHIWLKRSCLICQLFYKEQLDTEFLTYVIKHLLGSKEFFINKAIGWILRQYSRTNPQWVEQYSKSTVLHPLSKREALRLIK
ncbi:MULTISPECIES: DNA alkylation repair protein [unclassified Saccharicrinis]|uniref:DNA alkylation repair protein n=1 Tax=unclassified Saccharicrinis TaxID=2646859 RepID=UPI003D359780